MKDVRVPGVVWALVLVIGVGVIHEYADVWGLDPQIIDIFVVAAIAIIKSLALGTKELNQALDVIDLIRQRAAATRVRGSADAPAGVAPEAEATILATAEVPKRPNPVVAWLVG